MSDYPSSQARRRPLHILDDDDLSPDTWRDELPAQDPLDRYLMSINALHMKPFFPRQPKSLSGISVRAFCLGSAFAASLQVLVLLVFFIPHPAWRLPFFLAALSAFHFLEFWTTAERNTLVASNDSYLLTANWPAYAIAHSLAFLECFIVNVFFPGRTWAPYGLGSILLALGMVMVLGGQVVRSFAMLEAGASFNHLVQTTRKSTHELITSGIYSYFRHPSYFGFFYWGLGTQLVLGNILCFMAYAFVLWRFFSTRIRHEEGKLIEFFQQDYVDYRKRVWTGMPFIP
ncbi:Isoprenylcysteine carboxyl methyltransferase family-domain-containing protein [Stachybotrys elegans]|uniref:Protein-S-isoprenylcysteine O-methyltransferase n=1 Tax=Stachybotrys elegans TaxID=80388 RepID=A0A8K0T763_9HYPO|nr:Isoprenylcysteine carboxyl methyltransferase family-domain-containing protein [Stachybotrys elegans]